MAEAEDKEKLRDLQQRLYKVHKELNAIDRPVLKKMAYKKPKGPPLTPDDLLYLKDPQDSYWTQKASECKVAPSLLFNRALNHKFKYNDVKFDKTQDQKIFNGLEEGLTWLAIGLRLQKHPFACLRRYIKILSFEVDCWTPAEDEKLLEAVNKHGSSDWNKISVYFKNKTNVNCRNRFNKLKSVIKRGRWSQTEDELLKDACTKYLDKGWVYIATFIPGRSDIQCRERWSTAFNRERNTGRWSPQEDQLLLELVDKHNKKWSKISKEMGTRTDSQCRRRFNRLKEGGDETQS